MTIIGITLASLLSLAGSPAGPSSRPCSTQPTTAPATQSQPAVDAAVVEALRRLEASGQYETIQAKLDYRLEMPQLGDSEERTGWIAYRKATDQTPAMFRVHFETLSQLGGRAISQPVDYAFDGEFLTVAKHRIKDMVRYQVAGREGRIEPMRLGEGPFPLPFGQKADEVLEFFDAETPDRPQEGPKNTLYLLLTPRPEHRDGFSITRLEMWIDPELNLPVQVVSVDKSENITTIGFKELRLDEAIDMKTFKIPRKFGWHYRVERLGEGKNLAP